VKNRLKIGAANFFGYFLFWEKKATPPEGHLEKPLSEEQGVAP
jgi:hypothetical protein